MARKIPPQEVDLDRVRPVERVEKNLLGAFLADRSFVFNYIKDYMEEG